MTKIRITKRQFMGIIRHSMTFVGGILIISGILGDNIIWQEITGSFVTLLGIIWSVFDKN